MMAHQKNQLLPTKILAERNCRDAAHPDFLETPMIHRSLEYHGTSMMVRQWYRPNQEDGYDQETDERLDRVVRESTDQKEIIRRRLKATRMYFTQDSIKARSHECRRPDTPHQPVTSRRTCGSDNVAPVSDTCKCHTTPAPVLSTLMHRHSICQSMKSCLIKKSSVKKASFRGAGLKCPAIPMYAHENSSGWRSSSWIPRQIFRPDGKRARLHFLSLMKRCGQCTRWHTDLKESANIESNSPTKTCSADSGDEDLLCFPLPQYYEGGTGATPNRSSQLTGASCQTTFEFTRRQWCQIRR